MTHETGSIVNYLYERATKGQPEPQVGMGVTYLSWSDRSPGTIQAVRKEGRWTYIETTADDYERTDKNGFSESQTYRYTQKPDGHRVVFRRPTDEPNASWVGVRRNPETNRWVKTSNRIRIGHRERYWDPTF